MSSLITEGYLKNHDGDAEVQVGKKWTLIYFTYESRDTLKSFTLFITLQTEYATQF